MGKGRKRKGEGWGSEGGRGRQGEGRVGRQAGRDPKGTWQVCVAWGNPGMVAGMGKGRLGRGTRYGEGWQWGGGRRMKPTEWV